MTNTSEKMFKEFSLYFPVTAEKAIDYRETSRYELTIKLSNGDMVLYDDIDKAIRTLPKDLDNLTEVECRLEFGRRLRKIMYMKGITQVELSRRTGITQPMLSKYINGESSPSFYYTDKIAKALRCSIEEFRYTF